MENINTREKDFEIILRKPTVILKKVLRNAEKRSIVYETFPLLKNGNNFGSTIFKVQVSYTSKKGKYKEIHLVAKMLPPTQFQRLRFDSPLTFKKEVFLYENLMPTYKKMFEKCSKTSNCNGFDIVPKFFGSRLSLDPLQTEVDDDGVIMLENLQASNFYMCEKQLGLDLHHQKVALTALAKFHALGFSLKQKNIAYLQKIKEFLKPLDSDISLVKSLLFESLDVIKSQPDIQEFAQKIEVVIDHGLKRGTWRTCLEIEDEWSCIIHGDLWINNILFHRDEHKSIDSVKFVDFQTWHMSSPLRDFIYLICTSGQVNELVTHFDELLEIYRREILKILSEQGCDNARLFSKESVKKRLKFDAFYMLLYLMWVVKIFTSDGEDDENLPKNLEKPNHCYVERLRQIILLYVRENWI